MSSGSDYLKSILSAVASELLDLFDSIKFIAQVFMIVGSYFTKLINGRMEEMDWITLILKLAALIIKKHLLKSLDKQKEIELQKLKRFRKKKSKNIKLKGKKQKINLKFEKKGFRIELAFEISEYVLENFFTILSTL